MHTELTSMDLTALAAELVRMQRSKQDYTVDTRRIGWSSVGSTTLVTIDGAENHTPMVGPDADGHYTSGWVVNDYAHGQMADRLGIPRRYYDRLRADAPGLLDTNVRHWLIEKPERRMVRTLDGRVRAVLSDRYRRLDNYDLMERSIIPALEDVEGLTFQIAHLTPERMTVRALLPRVSGEVAVGDVVQAGVQVRNSEVGAGALEVTPFVWRLLCKNGMVVPDRALKARHVGRRVGDDDYDRMLYAIDTIHADDRAFFLKARDSVKAALREDLFDSLLDRMRAAAGGTEVRSAVEATERLAQTFTLADGEAESVLTRLAAGGDLTRWGVVNAVTAAAKQADSFDRQQEMERIGGEVLALPSREWAALAA